MQNIAYAWSVLESKALNIQFKSTFSKCSELLWLQTAIWMKKLLSEMTAKLNSTLEYTCTYEGNFTVFVKLLQIYTI